MKITGLALGALAVLVSLTGCGAGASVSAAPGGGASTTAPSKQRVVTSATPRAASETDFCRAAMAESRPALVAVQKLAKDPDDDDLTRATFQKPRDQLHKRELAAPSHLAGHLHTEVDVLDDILSSFGDVPDPKAQASRFSEARVEFILACNMAE